MLVICPGYRAHMLGALLRSLVPLCCSIAIGHCASSQFLYYMNTPPEPRRAHHKHFLSTFRSSSIHTRCWWSMASFSSTRGIYARRSGQPRRVLSHASMGYVAASAVLRGGATQPPLAGSPGLWLEPERLSTSARSGHTGREGALCQRVSARCVADAVTADRWSTSSRLCFEATRARRMGTHGR